MPLSHSFAVVDVYVQKNNIPNLQTDIIYNNENRFIRLFDTSFSNSWDEIANNTHSLNDTYDKERKKEKKNNHPYIFTVTPKYFLDHFDSLYLCKQIPQDWFTYRI